MRVYVKYEYVCRDCGCVMAQERKVLLSPYITIWCVSGPRPWDIAYKVCRLYDQKFVVAMTQVEVDKEK